MDRDDNAIADVTSVKPPPAGRAGWLWAPVLIAALLAISLLSYASHHFKFDLGLAGLGRETTAYFGEPGAPRTHCSDNRDTVRCEQAYRAAASPPAVLWLGNSQLHSINRYTPGQVTAQAILHRRLAAQGRYLVTYSEPNANLLEQRLLFHRLADIYDVRTLLLEVCLDDFRENGIRSELAEPVSAQSPGPHLSLQPLVEARLQSAFKIAPLWKERAALKGMIQYGAYTIRNHVLGIDAQTLRLVPPTVYSEKMRALSDILAQAAARHIDVVLYAPPYRNDIRGPYDTAQYAGFIKDMRGLADGDRVRFLDLTEIVPGPEWGRLVDPLFGLADYDFMHFTADGHSRLASALADEF